MSIEWKQKLKPQNRTWNQVCDMLLSIIHLRPVLLMCKACRGEHVCNDRSLTIHCACGTVTKYEPFGLFHQWSSLSWFKADDTNALRNMWLTSARVVTDVPLTNPQLPMDTRVMLWRLRGAG